MSSIPKTIMLSLKDPYLKEFQASVLAKPATPDGDAIILDKTAFHPKGGGQDSDIGLITGPKGSVEIISVKESDGVVHHIIGSLNGRVEAGDSVKGEIDWVRRYGLMKNHTAQHILWATLEKILSGVKIIGSAVMADKGRFDVQADRETLIQKLGAIESTANKIVKENRPVKIEMLDREDAIRAVTKYGESQSILPEGVDKIRIVEIEGWDIAACKGLHVKTTGEVGSIKILGRTSKGKNIDRLEFSAT